MKKMSNYEKRYMLSALLCLIPILIGLILYNKLPEQMPTHWNIKGEIDGYSSKNFTIFVIPFILLMVDLVSKFMIINDPKKNLMSQKLTRIFKYFIPVISIMTISFSVVAALDYKVDYVSTFIMSFVGVMFIIIGNYLPKLKQNYVMGIKVSWALNDEENWRKTHRVGGYTFIICGIIMILVPILQLNPIILIINVFAMTLIPCIYSYCIYKKGNN